jgi:hypothetical protein
MGVGLIPLTVLLATLLRGYASAQVKTTFEEREAPA